MASPSIVFEYLPDKKEGTDREKGRNAPDISEKFLGIVRNAGGFSAGDVDNAIRAMLAEYFMRTGDPGKAADTVYAIKAPVARLERTEWLIMSFLDAGDIGAAENAISQGLKSTNALQEERDFFTSQVILELCNKGFYSIAANIPIPKGIMGDADSECLQALAKAGAFIDSYDNKAARRELGKIWDAVNSAEEMAVPILVYAADMYHKAGAEADSEKAFKEAFSVSKKNMFFEFIAVRAAMAGHFDLVKSESKAVWDLVKGPEYKSVSDAFCGIAEYYRVSGDKERSREAILLAEENTAKLPDGQEKISALARIALFHKDNGDDGAAMAKFGELSEAFKKLPMRTLGYYYENVMFLDGVLKRLAGSGIGENASDLFSYLLELRGRFESAGRKSGDKMDSALLAITERAYDLSRYDEMAEAYEKLGDNSKKTEALRYMTANKRETDAHRLSGMVQEMLKAAGEGKLTAAESADAHITAAGLYSGSGDAGKAGTQLSLAFEAIATMGNPANAAGVREKYRLLARAAEIYFNLGEDAKALETAEGMMNDASEIRNGDLKKHVAASAMQALLFGYAKGSMEANRPYAPGRRYREYSKLYW